MGAATDSATTMHSKTVLEQIGEFLNNKTPFSHNSHMKSLEFIKITSLCSVWKKETFWDIILTQKQECMFYYPKWVVEITI